MNGKILIVDDEPDILTLLREVFEPRGHEVFTANSAMSGLNLARRCLPDVVLLDVVLGDMDGLSACEILRSQPSTARIPVIIMTAMGGEMVRMNSFAAGAIAFVGKPISRREVIERVEALLVSRVDIDSEAISDVLSADPGRSPSANAAGAGASFGRAGD